MSVQIIEIGDEHSVIRFIVAIYIIFFLSQAVL